jgi:DNA-binding beta-propeller fold protein YncE
MLIRTPSRHRILLAMLTCLGSACSDDKDEAPTSAGDLLVVANLEKSAFVGTTSMSGGVHDVSGSHEVGTYPEVSLRGRRVLVTARGDEVLSFTHEPDGSLAKGPTLPLPAGSRAIGTLFASQDKAYVSLSGAGKVLVIDPRSMTRTGEIDLSSLGAGDMNPDPAALFIRGGKLYIGLWQETGANNWRPEATLAIIDVATDTLDKSISDGRLGMASSTDDANGGFILDDKGDLYVYCVGAYGFDPRHRHGFLRILAGQTEYDSSYVFDMTDLPADVPGKKIDYLHLFQHAGGARVFGTGNVPAESSKPPNYATDFTMQIVDIDLTKKTMVAVPLPRSTGMSGALELVGGKLVVALAAKAGSGLYVYDFAGGGFADKMPRLPTQGSVSVVRRLDQ